MCVCVFCLFFWRGGGVVRERESEREKEREKVSGYIGSFLWYVSVDTECMC